MQLPTQIVIGFDFSPDARAALAGAVVLAERWQASVTVVTALPCALPAELMAHETSWRQIGREPGPPLAQVERFVQRLVRDDVRALPGVSVPVAYLTTSGSPVDLILGALPDRQPALIAIGALGQERYRDRRFLGIDALRIVRLSPAPVLVVKPDLPFPPRRILCGVDESDTAAEAFHWSVAFARIAEAPLTALHAVAPEPAAFASTILPGYIPAVRPEEADGDGLDWLEALAAEARPGLAVEARTAEGEAAPCILDALDTGDYDLLVVGAVSRQGGLGHRLGGRAERLVHHAQTNLLVVKPPAAR